MPCTVRVHRCWQGSVSAGKDFPQPLQSDEGRWYSKQAGERMQKGLQTEKSLTVSKGWCLP